MKYTYIITIILVITHFSAHSQKNDLKSLTNEVHILINNLEDNRTELHGLNRENSNLRRRVTVLHNKNRDLRLKIESLKNDLLIANRQLQIDSLLILIVPKKIDTLKLKLLNRKIIPLETTIKMKDENEYLIKRLQENKNVFFKLQKAKSDLIKELNGQIKYIDLLTNNIDNLNQQNEQLSGTSKNLILANSKLELANQKHLITKTKLSKTIKEKNLLMLFSLIILILAAIAFWQAKKAKQQRKKAEQQTKYIKAQQKELSHRIKNNLQELNSYLDIQKLKTTNETTKQELSKSQQLIVTFGNIHKFLYKNDNPEMVNIQDYFRQFIGELISAAPTIKNQIKTSIQISDVKLPTQQVFYMALAINELITNAFKYAYQGVENPELFIHFNYAENGNSELIVKDNGCGLPNDYNERIENSMGTYIIKTNVEQLYGSMNIQTGKQGTTYNIKLDLSQKVA